MYNHKLIKFNLVIHAGINGFSRNVYAKCVDNNTAETALEAFGINNRSLKPTYTCVNY